MQDLVRVPMGELVGVGTLLMRYDDLKAWAERPWAGSKQVPPLCAAIATLLCYDMVGKEQSLVPPGAPQGEFLMAEMRGKALKGVVYHIARQYLEALNTAGSEPGRYPPTVQPPRALEEAYANMLVQPWDVGPFSQPELYVDLPATTGSVFKGMMHRQGNAAVTLRPKLPLADLVRAVWDKLQKRGDLPTTPQKEPDLLKGRLLELHQILNGRVHALERSMHTVFYEEEISLRAVEGFEEYCTRMHRAVFKH